MKRYAAFFDLDDTLLTSSSGKLFIQYSYQHNLISHNELLYGMAMFLVHRLGFIKTEGLVRKWAMKYQGWPEKKMLDFANNFFHEVLVHHFRNSMTGEIEHHKKNGGLTVLLSASTSFLCEMVRDHFKMDDIICTTLALDSGFYTGQLAGEYCYGAEKLNRAVAYCTKRGFSMSDAYYYADSFADVPVFELVGYPVCVNPDRRLKRLARTRGWRSIRH